MKNTANKNIFVLVVRILSFRHLLIIDVLLYWSSNAYLCSIFPSFCFVVCIPFGTWIQEQIVHPAFKWIWKSACQWKHKVFFWLLLKDRLSTRNLLKRRNMALDDYNCVLCSSLVEEGLDHLFLHCSFARQCWDTLSLDIQPNSSFPTVVSSFRVKMQSQFFMVAVILMVWSI